MQVENRNSIRGFIKLARLHGYKIFERPYELNIIGVRNSSTIPNKFDDRIVVFYKNDKGAWEGKSFNATTDPGTYWLENPMNPQGTAILQGNKQFINAWKLGLHQGKYKALVQAKPVPVLRQYDRKAILDFNNGKIDVGMHGINMHRANQTGTTKTVDKNSAGCQVLENAEDFNKFLGMAEKHADLYGNQFSYTLIDERAYLRAIKRRGTYVVAGLIIATSIYVAYRLYNNKPIIPKF